jgi:hypothetical protein
VTEERSERAPASPAGALEVFIVGSLSIIYKRAAGALKLFAADWLSTIYKRAAEPLTMFGGTFDCL